MKTDLVQLERNALSNLRIAIHWSHRNVTFGTEWHRNRLLTFAHVSVQILKLKITIHTFMEYMLTHQTQYLVLINNYP